MMPQGLFLDFLRGQVPVSAGFHLEMRAEATGLNRGGGPGDRVRGTAAWLPFELRPISWSPPTPLLVLRERAGPAVETWVAPMDVLWFRSLARPGDPRPSWVFRRG